MTVSVDTSPRIICWPRSFCWTKYGAEAGETAPDILARKEVERERNGGMFLWGIGNNVWPSIQSLLQLTEAPEVLFSPIQGRPAAHDEHPDAVRVWRAAVTPQGERFMLPVHSTVTSRANTRAHHYALVLHSSDPLIEAEVGRLDVERLRNLRSGMRLGSSQVTSVVTCLDQDATTGRYRVTLRARLVKPFLVRLVDAAPEALW